MKKIMVIICLVVFTFSVSATIFVGQGEARFKKKKKIMQARNQALLNARKDILLKSVKSDLTESDFEKVRSGLSDSSFLNLASGFIRNEVIANENVANKLYQITIRGEVDLELLRNEIKVRFRITSDTKSRKSVMLLIDEYFSADFVPESSRVSREETVYEKKDIVEDDKDIRRSGSNASHKRKKKSASYKGSENHDDQGSVKLTKNIDVKSSNKLNASGNVSIDGDNASGKVSASTNDSVKVNNNSSASYSSKGSSKVKASLATDVTDSKSSSHSSKNKTHFFKDQSVYEKKVVEYFPPDALKVKNPVPFVSALIENSMLKRDIKILDKSITEKLRNEVFGEKGLVNSFTSGDSTKLINAASKAGNEYGADMIVVGVNSIVDAGRSGNMFITKSSIALKIIDASTGEIIASYAYTQGGQSTAIQTSAKISAQRLGSIVGPEISEQFVEYWKKRVSRGFEFNITVVGLKSTRGKFMFKKIFKKLQAQEKISSFEERRFDKQQSIFELVVTSKMKITDFKDAFLEIVYEIPEYQNLEEESSRGNSIVYKIK